ncbi:hydratase [Caproicibacter sp. BJN0012]|uniref:hydratase n=1 Tax=Caproicibacter sp. BJN0012 TaxID=3110227 RepID=UPI002E143521
MKLYPNGVYVIKGREIIEDTAGNAGRLKAAAQGADLKKAREGTISYSILRTHNHSGRMDQLKIRFDALASHDITFVGIVQTAKASGMKEFPIPYVLTNCHNSLCAVGGTINEDDHMFGLSAAKKYGGIYVPPHLAVIHMYMREMMAGCGKMILGSDSHTRYGALGTMAIGEGGGELVKQLLCKTYDIDYPRVVGVYLTGKPRPGVGPQDVALTIIGEVFQSGYVKNSIMEFIGDGIGNLSADYRCGIDVMTTETACLSSIWETDEGTREFFDIHGRTEDYKKLEPADVAYYDGMIYLDLSTVKPMIALPFHPSNSYEIGTFCENLEDILHGVEERAVKTLGNPSVKGSLTGKIVNGRLKVDQGVIAGCAGGTFSNVMAADSILKEQNIGNGEFSLSVYPSSQPVLLELTRNGALSDLMAAGAVIRTAFCGPCFGAGDVPANGALSIRHTTRNFPNREGSRPGAGQIAYVALMDARSIAATAKNKGFLTSAENCDTDSAIPKYFFDRHPYENRVYDGFGKAELKTELRYGPNIVDWPEIGPLADDLLLKVVSYLTDPVTTTDELIPSGETSSYRSNPLGLAEFTLSRKDPAYVGRAKAVQKLEKVRLNGENPEKASPELHKIFAKIRSIKGFESAGPMKMGIGSTIYAVKPGDGSAREQAASCQRVLGGSANIAREYATKRYRSNLINWGMLPFLLDGEPEFGNGSYLFVPRIREKIAGDSYSQIEAYVIGEDVKKIKLRIAPLTPDERRIIQAGCLINFNRL